MLLLLFVLNISFVELVYANPDPESLLVHPDLQKTDGIVRKYNTSAITQQQGEIVYVVFGDSFTVQCPFVETQTISWKFLPRQSSRVNYNYFDNSEDQLFLRLNYTCTSIFIPSANISHNGTYQCNVNSNEVFNIDVFVKAIPPRIIRPEYSGITVDYGKSLSISCEAEGNPFPEITWSWPAHGVMHDIIEPSTTRVFTRPDHLLHINKISTAYGVAYICTARNVAGEVRHSVLVSVSSMAPVIQTNDLNKTVNEGERVWLDCSTNALPQARLEWILPDGSIITSANNSVFSTQQVLQNGSIVISQVEIQHGGIYGCVATNPIGQASIEVVLNVRHKTTTTTATTTTTTTATTTTTTTSKATAFTRFFSLDEDEEEIDDDDYDNSLYIRQYRSEIYSKHGSNVFLHCRSNFPRETRLTERGTYHQSKRVNAQWTTPSGQPAAFPYPVPSWRERVLMNGTLKIYDVGLAQAGTYVCTAQDRQGRKIRTFVKLKVVTQPPFVKQTLYEVIIVSKDRAAWAPCSASGYPKPKIIWRTPHGRTFTPGSYGNGLRVFSDGKLMLHGVTNENAGTYVCTASNSAGSVSRSVVFKLRTFAPIIRGIRSITKYVHLGGSTRLTCTALGVPKPDQYWSLPGGKIMNKNEGLFESRYIQSKMSMSTAGTLIINRAEFNDAGLYYCYATNWRGTAVKTVHLKVYR